MGNGMRFGRMKETLLPGSLFGLLSILLVLIAGAPGWAVDNTEALTPSGNPLGEVLADFEAYAGQAMRDWQVPGMAVAIVENDRLVYARGFGVKEYGKEDPVTEHTIFQIGSTSKAFTAALVAMLVDEGKVQWNDRVIDHLPDFRMYDPWVTREFMVKDLMAQHSGLPGYEGDFQAFLGFERNHIVHSLRYFQPVSSFRSEFAYQNSLFLVAAQLIEELTGLSWEEMLKERIFQPLGMDHSFSDISGYLFNPEAALSHEHANGEPVVLTMDWPFHFWIDTYSPAGGIHSNVADMAQWLRLMLNHGTFEENELLNEKQVHYLQKAHTPIHSVGSEPMYSAYCQAWVRTRYQPYDLVWHDGGTTGMTAVVKMIPDQGLGIVVLTNLGGHSLPHSVAFYLVDRYLGNPFLDWSQEHLAARVPVEPQPAPPDAPPMPLDLYTGNYTNPVFGDAMVFEEEGTLKIALGPRAIELHLQPWSRDSFLGTIERLSGSDTIIDFHFPGGEAPAQSFLIHLLHTAGCGKWIRVEQ